MQETCLATELTEISELVKSKLVSQRPHPTQPLVIYNYTAKAQHIGIAEWSMPLQKCRGLILTEHGEIVGRPFSKFWNYEQVLDQIPASEPYTIWEKVDGSLGIICSYNGELVVATRGSFESDQAQWARQWLQANYPRFLPADGHTYLFEIVYPENRIVVDYGERAGLVLLSVMNKDGRDNDPVFHSAPFDKAKRYESINLSAINSIPDLTGQEGLVVRWESGFRAKLKLDEYKRLHRLITQCSTRTIWEMLRAGKSTDELLDRVPEDFKRWAIDQTRSLLQNHESLKQWAVREHARIPNASRKEFAEVAKRTPHPALLFLLLDGRDISDAVWKMVEPCWSRPFKQVEE